MAGLRLTTLRLELVAGTPELVAADVAGREELARALGAEVPVAWPPDLYDREAAEHSLAQLRKGGPEEVGWALWYLLRRDSGGGRPTAVGICGFKGSPTAEGTVEIGYSVLAEHQREGFASEAVGALLEWAFSFPTVSLVVAETYPELSPSIRVLERNGFQLAGQGSEERVIRYELPRSAFAGVV